MLWLLEDPDITSAGAQDLKCGLFVQFAADLLRFNGGNDAIACVDDGGSCSSLHEHFSARVES